MAKINKRSDAGQVFQVLLERRAGSAGEKVDGKTFVIQESIGYLLSTNARLLQREMTACLAEHGVAHAHWSIMLVLWAGDGLTQKELSRRVAIEEPTLARSLAGMERKDLVRRKRDSVDGRQMLVFLTKRSAALRDVLVPLAFSVQEQTISVLTETERTILVVLLQKALAGNRRREMALPDERP